MHLIFQTIPLSCFIGVSVECKTFVRQELAAKMGLVS